MPSAEGFAKQFHVPRLHDSYQSLVEDPNVDVVYVASVNSCHYRNCLDALQAGKPVLCEKPFMVNIKEAEGVISFAHEKRLFLMEALWTWFIPAFKRARQMWESGIIGDVRVAMSEFGFIIIVHRVSHSTLMARKRRFLISHTKAMDGTTKP